MLGSCGVLLLGGCSPDGRERAEPTAYVGEAACARCHPAEAAAWRGSHHDLAMQAVTDSTVLGDFRDTEFRSAGMVSRFFRRDGRFMVRTEGPDGAPADFEISYTFGVFPLQQYLIAMPGGRLQAFGIAWDARPKSAGGTRWFSLHPGERVTHDDVLHWTRWPQNWNLQCAACHSTNLHKNYDDSTRTYHTTWSELNVSCEACHGPGSRHAALASRSGGRGAAGGSVGGFDVALNERRGATWARDPATGLIRRSAPRTTASEIETCARCHSRRGRRFDQDPPGGPLLQAHLPALLTADLYEADGQIHDEVYEVGSFTQSRMNHEGVTCSDCHDPHRLTLRAAGNGVCARCHDATGYDVPQHHHHRQGSPEAACVSCHMPTRTYMVVHERHDHGLRVPRPDLTEKIGTPNACNDCHGDRSARWAAERVRAWYQHGPTGYQRYAEALHAARAGAPDAPTRLIALLGERDQPAIARATAAATLGEWPGDSSRAAIETALADADPLVRAGALEGLDQVDPAQRWALAAPLLRDSLRVLRALAGAALAGTPGDRVPRAAQADFERACADYVASEMENADQPPAQVNLGTFYAERGDPVRAERAYRAALALDPDWVPSYVDLADLLRVTGRDAEGETLLRAGLARQPAAAALHHSLGLLLVRRKDLNGALASLERATELEPDNARFAYVYAVGLDGAGRRADARRVIEKALALRPGDRSLLELRSQLGASGGP